MEKEKKFEKMAVVNPRAAGIDIGSKSHWVAVGQNPARAHSRQAKQKIFTISCL